MRKQVSARVLHRLISYDPSTGRMTWRERPAWMFKSKKSSATWNTRFSGRPAFITDTGNGYLSGCVFDRQYLAHRVAWCLYHGEWPEQHIDHINGRKSDNSIVNLRDVSRFENARNTKIPSTNKSGVIGVRMNQRTKTWEAWIRVRGKSKHLGYFKRRDDACAARLAAERAHGFHENHGRQM